MILDLLMDLGCILFLLLTAMFCFSWVRLRNDLPWNGRRWVAVVVKSVALLIGAWHLVYGILKLVYLLLWMATT